MPQLPPLPRPRPASAKLNLTQVLRAHYLEMPGLSLTATQARRLCGMTDLDLPAFERLLEELVQKHFLTKTSDGRYRRAA